MTNRRKEMRRRRDAADRGGNKQFNPNNGEQHTQTWLAEQRKLGLRRQRTHLIGIR